MQGGRRRSYRRQPEQEQQLMIRFLLVGSDQPIEREREYWLDKQEYEASYPVDDTNNWIFQGAQ
jgi:hypothetical protein